MTNSTHQSYLLRLWRDHADAPPRATVVGVAQPNVPRHFATLDALFAFLHAQAYPVAVLAEAEAHQARESDGDYCTPDDQE